LLIEIPSPVRLVIPGVLKALLPDQDTRLLILQVNFLGTVEFEKEELAFDASLYESRLLSYPLAGDMALRLNWGDDPNFVLTVGGFHPAYKPPTGLGSLTRLSVNLLNGDNPRLRLETYFAITSNTVQFGARIELYAKKGKFNVYGFLSFDTLFQFSPFYFIAEVQAGLALRVGSHTIMGIRLSLTLSGPTPWNARGRASIDILFFSISVSFNVTFGERRDTTLPDIAILPLLIAALQDTNNWQAQLPPQFSILVTTRDLPSITDAVVVHPFGTLTISQKVVPLGMTIDRFGNAKPAGANRFEIKEVSSSNGVLETSTVEDEFALGQFQDLSDAQRLTRKSFEKIKSGVQVQPLVRVQSSYAVHRKVEYEATIIDRNGFHFPLLKLIQESLAVFAALLNGNVAAKSALSFARVAPSPLNPPKISLIQEGFAVVSTVDLTLAHEQAIAPSQAEAVSRMTELIAANPALADAIQVVPTYEVNQP
jgi:hypothetical protein